MRWRAGGADACGGTAYARYSWQRYSRWGGTGCAAQRRGCGAGWNDCGAGGCGDGGKAGGVPLPGVAITAMNTLTGRKYATTTDIDGRYAMAIPRNGRYVVRAELAGFAEVTQEVVLNGVEAQAANQGITIVPKATDFGMQLASRVAAEEAKQADGGGGSRSGAGRGCRG